MTKMKKKDPKLFTYKERAELLESIKCISILKYLDEYVGKSYVGPKKVKPEEQDIYNDIKEKGGAAVKELDKMARLCEIDFRLKNFGTCKWLDGSNTKIREYLWRQMKFKGYEKCPTSISLFAEIAEGDKARFRFSVELNEAQSKTKDYDRHHKILDKDISDGHNLTYMLNGNNSKVPMRKIKESTKVVKEKVANETYKKVQISFIITQKDIEEKHYSNKEILNVMIGAIADLMPYYKLVLGNETKMTDILQEKEVEDNTNSVESNFDKNMILYGPPGTGKTYNTVNYAVAIIDNEKIEDVEKRSYKEVFKRYLELKSLGKIAFTTFHQSYGYEEFIEGIKPVIEGEGIHSDSSDVKYKYSDGVFKKFCNKAKKINGYSLENGENTELIIEGNNAPYVFIIDEINRGNISKIFGELITLIESTKRLGEEEETTALLPYTSEEFGVPNNVYILGTMNTADRSIALMDTALRRRFKFIEMMPNSSVIDDMNISDIEGINISKMLDTINERIEYLFDREHTIGHAYFTPLKKEPTLNKLASIFQNKIIPLLQEYFYEDYEKIQLVLGDNAKEDQFKFILDTTINVRNVFKGNPDIDLPEKKYEIQKSAFDKAESYKQIY